MLTYIAIKITLPDVGDGYQELSESGDVLRITDFDGVVVTAEAMEYHVVDASPERPAWAAPLPAEGG